MLALPPMVKAVSILTSPLALSRPLSTLSPVVYEPSALKKMRPAPSSMSEFNVTAPLPVDRYRLPPLVLIGEFSVRSPPPMLSESPQIRT